MEKAQKNYDRRHRTGTGAIVTAAIAVAALLSILALTTCKPMFLQDIAGYVPVYSQVVGTDGGTVTDSRGASVEIPAGALAEATTITIATYENPGGIYSRHGVTPFTGGADFGPDGIEFLKPVTITLPTSQKMVPGQTQPLFMQNPDTGVWEMTGFTLTAAADCYSATAEVTHFTPYVSSLLPPGALSKIEEFFDGTNGQVALGSYMAWFLTATDLYGYTTECGDSVYEVVGLFFDFTWQAGGVPGTAVSEYGDVSLDTVAQLNYSYDTASTDGPEYIYNMLVTVYFDVTENPPEAEANISILEPVPGSTVEGIETISTYIVTGDSDTDIDSVAFYADGSLLGSDAEAPFQWYWDTGSLADGEHTLTATAAFSGGESVESEAVSVVVGDGGDTVAAPVFDPLPGQVAAGSEITITCATSGSLIYYTNDGSSPDQTSGTHYTAPIIIEAETTLSAIAVKEGWENSTVTTGTYELNGPKIVFMSNISGAIEIYKMNPDGTDVTRLTFDGEVKYEPSFSPDGTKITYIRGSDADDTSEVYVMNADGSNQTRLTFNTCRDSRPVFSPDGTKIAFSTMRDATVDHPWNSEVYVMNVDGSFPTRLTYSNYADDHPSFAPDGESIVFNSRRDNTAEWTAPAEVYVMGADGSGQTRLTYTDGNANSPEYAPNGVSILYTSSTDTGSQIFEMAANGSNPTQLTFGTNQCMQPMYSPEGRKIVFFKVQLIEPYGKTIYIMDRDETSISEIADGWHPSF